jgi:ATP-dependent Zn protease
LELALSNKNWKRLSLDQEKLKTAYHETAHAVMALICGLKIRKVSIKGTDKYRGVMSTEPPERQITTPAEALREVRISLSGFIGEVLISGKYTIFRSHPDLTSAIELIEDMLAFDEKFKDLVVNLTATNPGTLTDIENPLVRAYIEGKLSWCLNKLNQYKPVIKLIAEKLYETEELAGDEVSALFNSLTQSSLGADQLSRPSPIL